MLPAFDNIVRLTDHGDASFFGAYGWHVEDTNDGILTLDNPGNPNGPTRIYAAPNAVNTGHVSLFAR